MTIDYNKPVEGDLYNDDLLTTIRDNMAAAVKMDFTGSSNLPTGAIDYLVSNNTFRRWSGTAWVALNIAFPSGTIMLFGQSTAPTGWTRKADWTDNAMLCYKAASSIATGGTANPKDGHVHAGGSHAHGLNSHTHSSGVHTHVPGTLQFKTVSLLSGILRAFNIGGSYVSLNASLGVSDTPLEAYRAAFGTVAATDYYTAAGTGTTGAGSGNTGGPTTATDTAAGGTGNTGQNTTPVYQEVIAATKD